jgi:hypothetical protein
MVSEFIQHSFGFFSIGSFDFESHFRCSGEADAFEKIIYHFMYSFFQINEITKEF